MKIKLFKSLLSISILLILYFKRVHMESYGDELPNDVEKLKQIIQQDRSLIKHLKNDREQDRSLIKHLKNDREQDKHDLKYLNEVVLGDVPVPHRRTALRKMQELDEMSEDDERRDIERLSVDYEINSFYGGYKWLERLKNITEEHFVIISSLNKTFFSTEISSRTL